jgi:hypothetical protein
VSFVLIVLVVREKTAAVMGCRLRGDEELVAINAKIIQGIIEKRSATTSHREVVRHTCFR